jgi:ATP-dependent DNA helicase RecG
MITKEKIVKLLADMESDLIERTIFVKEDKLGPAVCAFSNDFPNHKQQGYIFFRFMESLPSSTSL